MKPPEFDIQPYIGALPIRFGLPRSEVPALLGSQPHAPRDDADDFGTVRVAYYGTGVVTEIGFVPRGVILRFMGIELWSEHLATDPIPLLLQHDPDPVESSGFLVFSGIGVTATGFHDDDFSQRAITVFCRGHWDSFLPTATKPNLTKYRK